jgi:hypothetical protein
MEKVMNNPVFKFLLALCFSPMLHAAIIFSLYPNNDLVPPSPPVFAGNGNTVGIGFSLQNDAAGYMVISSVFLNTDPSPTGTAAQWTDLLSTYVSNNSFALAPSTTFAQTWVANTSGLGEFAFNSSPVAFTGPLVTVTLQYDLFDADPFAGAANQIGFGLTLDTPVQFNESAPLTAPVPEPATLGICALSLMVLAAARAPREYTRFGKPHVSTFLPFLNRASRKRAVSRRFQEYLD